MLDGQPFFYYNVSIIMKKLEDYNINENVEVKIQIGNNHEWRQAKVIDKRIIDAHFYNRSRHRPYTMLIVNVVRTYFNNLTKSYYDKMNTEGFVYADQVR